MSTKQAFAMGYEHGLKGMRKLVHRDGRKYPKQQDQFRYNVGYRAGEQRRLDKVAQQAHKEQSNDKV